MKERSRRILFAIAVLIVFWLIWSRLRIHVFVRLSGWGAVFWLIVLVLAVFLVLDHLINREA